ncbi:hypothetical protein [uncultured Flavobacterium sp.]|uniref:hypothetical protein n=1 Tax=uncultured Flavobacterium sp. TaxID=165435 RepID=UPI0025ED3B1E|nr:hypothetical protein [uncultured Flavobacterium sp.]
MKNYNVFRFIAALGLFYSFETHAQVKIGSNPTKIDANANLEVEGANGYKVSVNRQGKLIIKDGSEGVGKVLLTDANGVATWVRLIENQSGKTGAPDLPGSGLPGAPAEGVNFVTNDSGLWIYNPADKAWSLVKGAKGDIGISGGKGAPGTAGSAVPGNSNFYIDQSTGTVYILAPGADPSKPASWLPINGTNGIDGKNGINGGNGMPGTSGTPALDETVQMYIDYSTGLVYVRDPKDKNKWVPLTGIKGDTGADGKSAFDIWKEIPGNENKTQADFVAGITGATGA